MEKPTGKGANTLLVISVLVLAATILFTAAYAIFIRPSAQQPEEAPASSAPAELKQPRATEAPKAASSAAERTAEPDWAEAERLLEDMAAQPVETVTPAPTVAENPFLDVKESDYFYVPALWARERGVLIGDTLSPADKCTRGQVMTFLWRMAGSPTPNLKVSPFNDTSETDYFFQPVLWAFESGLISTPSDGKFRPSDTVTRAQVMLFLFRMDSGSADGMENPFSDVPDNSYYHDAALWAYARGIVLLNDARSFDAADECTRGQFITFLYRCFAE